MSIILAVFVGLFTIKLGMLYSLGLLASVMIFIATLKYPEFIILLIIGCVSRLLPAQFNYYLEVAGRGFFLTDFLFFSLLAVMFLKLLADIPLLVLGVAVITGAATATFIHNINFSDTTPEARILLYYLIFFPVTNLIRSKGQLNRLVRGLFLIGILMALVMIVQAIFGTSINLIDKSTLMGSGELVRFFNPGFLLVHLTLMVLLCGLALRVDHHRRYLKLALIIVLGIALLLTLGRNLLVSTALSLGVLAFLLRKRQLPRLVVNGIFIAAAAFGIFGAIQILGIVPNIFRYFSLYISRFTQLFTANLLSPEDNLGWRWNEILFAWPKLMDNPILGIGLHTPYRPPFYVGDKITNFIHNAYLMLWLRTGLLGLIAFLWLSFRFLSRGFRYWRSISDRLAREIVLGLTLGYLSMVISNLVAPTLVSDLNTALIGVILGINEVIYIHFRPQAKRL
jgi:O-antigen ligase